MVQAWYQGGVSVFDFTDSAKPVEIAFFDRGPLDAKQPDHRRLLVDLLVQRPHLRHRDRPRPRRLQADAERASVAERDRRGAARSRRPSSTRSSSRRSSWPASSVVARAYRRSADAQQGHPAGAGERPSLPRSSALTGSTRAATRARRGVLRRARRARDGARRRCRQGDAAATRRGCASLASTLKGRAAGLR